MRALRIAFLALFFGFALLPFVNQRFVIIPDVVLLGVTDPPTEVPFSWGAYWSNRFQPSYEARYDAELSLRGRFVRADNELNLRAFHQVGLNPRTSLIIGKDDYLFERSYVDAFNRHDEVPSSAMEPKVERLALLQKYLESRGSMLLLVITPSKPLLYPEYLPPRYVFKERHSVPTNYEKFVPLLNKHGIYTVDGQAYLQERKPQVPFTFFGNSSTHWNEVGACEVTALAMDAIARQLKQPLPALRCHPHSASMRQRKRDIDILQLCNLWYEDRLYQPVYRPRARPASRSAVPMPSLLVIGGSFSFHMADYFRMYHIDHTIYRYYSTQYYRNRKTPIVREAIDWEKDVFSKQIVLVEVNAEIVHNVGFGFLEDAERVIAAQHH